MDQLNTSGRALLIDLDGTLVDTAPDIAAAANRMLDELGARALPFTTISSFIGHGVSRLVRRALAASRLDDTDADAAEALFYQHYRHTNGQFGRVFPGVRNGVTALRRAGYRLACVTNKPTEFTWPLLQLAGLEDYFDSVVGGDTLASMKPAPEPLLHACAAVGVVPAHAVMVGDSAVDVAAARAAGMPVFIVRYGYPGPGGLAVLDCDGFIDSFEELPALLQTHIFPQCESD